MSCSQGDNITFGFGEFCQVPLGDCGLSSSNAFHENMNGHDKFEPAKVDEDLSVPDGVFRHFIAVGRQCFSHDLPRLNTTERFEIRENPENKGNTLIWVIDQRIAEFRRKTGTVSKRAAVALTTQVAA